MHSIPRVNPKLCARGLVRISLPCHPHSVAQTMKGEPHFTKKKNLRYGESSSLPLHIKSPESLVNSLDTFVIFIILAKGNFDLNILKIDLYRHFNNGGGSKSKLFTPSRFQQLIV